MDRVGGLDLEGWVEQMWVGSKYSRWVGGCACVGVYWIPLMLSHYGFYLVFLKSEYILIT